MKRFLMIFMALMLICASALAYNENAVVDGADLLSASEEAQLQQLSDQIYAEYDFQTVFHTTNGTNGQPIHLYAADFYDGNGYGYGVNCDGIIFVVDMANREYVTVTTGSGIHYFSDYTISMMEENIVSDLSDGNYYDAFEEYLEQVDNQLKYVSNVSDEEQLNEFVLTPNMDITINYYGYEPDYTYYGDEITAGGKLLIAMAVALVITAIVLAVMISTMKTARKKDEASDYLQNVDLTRVSDVYLYTTEKRRRIQTSSSSGKGGSSTFRGSSGTSHGGGRSGRF